MNKNRRSIRLHAYDYTQAGVYDITICAHNRACIFGHVANGEIFLNEYGDIVYDEWIRSSELRTDIRLDQFIVMPNHFHGIIWLNESRRGTARRAPTSRRAPTLRRAPAAVERYGKPVSGSIPTIIRSFKSAVTKRINECRKTPGASVWQRNYYEHIIRDENELHQKREYILNNPLKWDEDRDNIN